MSTNDEPVRKMPPTPKPESPTPRTDVVVWLADHEGHEAVDAEFARQLERELADEREEVQRLTQMVANAANELASRSASAERDPWKEAIIDGLIVNHIYSKADEEDPRKALNKLLAWEQSVALDPKVSSAAEALVEQGRQSVLSATEASKP